MTKVIATINSPAKTPESLYKPSKNRRISNLYNDQRQQLNGFLTPFSCLGVANYYLLYLAIILAPVAPASAAHSAAMVAPMAFNAPCNSALG